MLIQKVKAYFDKYPELSVLFYFDPLEEYKSEIHNWQERDIQLVVADSRQFALKYRLENEFRGNKVFIYFNSNAPTGNNMKHFVMMDILKANKVLHIDDVEEFMQEFGLKSYQRDLVKRYIKYLKLKKNQKTLSKLLRVDSFDDERALKLGLISCFLNSSSIDDETTIIAKIFIFILNNEFDELLNKIREIDGESVLLKLLDDYFDIESDIASKEKYLQALRKYKYSLITQHIAKPLPTDNYSALKIIKPKKLNLLNQLTADWLKDIKIALFIYEVFDKLAPDVNEEEIVRLYGIEAEYGFYNKTITIKILSEVATYIEYNPDRTISILNGIKSNIASYLNDLCCLIDCLILSANIYKTLNAVTSMILDKPKDYIEEYIEKYYLIDYFYRKALSKLDELRTLDIPGELDPSGLASKLNSKYEEYLKELNTQWMKCLKDHDFEFNNIPVLKQNEFYKHFIQGTEQKIAVIISDGLRYEVAKELMDVLHNDPKHQAGIGYMLSGLPSNTKLGMANLLPNQEIQLKDDLFLVDSQATEGIDNREKILQSYNTDSKAIQYDKLIQLNREEAREFFKSKITYIYHNRIDAIGDDKKTEKQTINAVERTISELAPLITRIHATYNVSRIIITADHGFLFNPLDLPESMYESLPDKNAIVNHNRFSIVKDNIKTDSYIFELSKASPVKTDLMITIPKAINRYKRQGHGALYVHGGASLQEMIIPVIESTRKREEVAEKVTFRLVNRDLKIVSSAIKVKFIQDMPVNKDYKEINLLCGIYTDVDELVSNEIGFTLDSTSDMPTQRTKDIILNLGSKSGTTSILYLKVFDKDKDPNRLNPIIKEKVINQTLIQSEFD